MDTNNLKIVGTGFSNEVQANISRWLNGEISGQTCAKIVVEGAADVLPVLGVAAGAAFGACVGTSVVPGFGTAIGGAVCAAVGGLLGGVVNNTIKYLSDNVFSLPPEKAVKKAYAELGLAPDSATEEINQAYLRKSLQFHHNGQEDKEKYLSLLVAVEVIRASRRFKKLSSRRSKIGENM